MSVDDFSDALRRRNSPTGDWRDGLSKTESGVPRKNLHNACVALRDHPELKGRITYDEFSGCTYVRGALPWDDRPRRAWSSFDDLAATEWLQSAGVGILVGSIVAGEAVERVAYENRFHPVLEWLEDLKWDGTERLNGWLTTYLGVTRSTLSDAIGRAFLVSAVARIQRPGCKVDHMLILEGPQGVLKSTALRTLTGNDAWFADQIADLGTKDSCQDLRGRWIVELSELDAMRRGSEVERIKAYVSRQTDHYRPSYGRRSGDVPRQCVFAGTTNAEEYLADTTGGRRYWPLKCGLIQIDDIARDKDQLWAEAVAAYHAGAPWWITDDNLKLLVKKEQEARRIHDPWKSVIAAWLDNPTKAPNRDGIRIPFDDGTPITIAAILEHAIVKPVERQSKADQMRVSAAMRLLGWQKRHTRDGNIWSRVEDVNTSSDDDVNTSADVNTSEFTVNTSGEGGVHAKNSQNGGFQDDVNTVNTVRARVTEKEEDQTIQGTSHGVHGDHRNGSVATPDWPDAPPVGTVEDGWRYIGGDPAEQSSWEQVQ